MDTSWSFKFSYYSLTLLLATSICVEAHYNVSISVHSFSNPTSKCATCNSTSATSIERLGCCDNHNNLGTCSGDERCDPAFYFCLLPLNGMSFRDCVTGIGASTTAPYYQGNKTSIFSSSNRFSGLDVPFMLSGISNEWTGVQLYIRARDADNILPNGTNFWRDDDIIDQFYINITSPVGITTSLRDYNGIHGLATMQLSFRITCAQYYYGENCENLNECELNSVACNRRGQCEDGVDTYTCVCDPRYSGTHCQDLNDCYLNSVTCNGNGQCVDGMGTYTCDCDPGYTGKLCDQKQVLASVAAIAGGVTGGVIALVVIITVLVCGGVLICKWWNRIPKTTTSTRPAATTTAGGTSETTIASLGVTAPPPHQLPPPYPAEYPPQNQYYLPQQPGNPPQMYPQYKGPETVEMNTYPGVY